MKALKFFTFLVLFLFSGIMVSAQSNNNNIVIPVGMEQVVIGGALEGGGRIIVPMGAKTQKIGGQIIVEGTKEYMSRRFYENDGRFKAIETRLAATDGRLTNVEGRITTVEDRLTKIEDRLTAIENNQADILKAISAIRDMLKEPQSQAQREPADLSR